MPKGRKIDKLIKGIKVAKLKEKEKQKVKMLEEIEKLIGVIKSQNLQKRKRKILTS